MEVWGPTSPRSSWRPQKLATRAQPLPPETSFSPFVFILNLSFEGRKEPVVLGTGENRCRKVGCESRLAGLGLRVPFINPFRKGRGGSVAPSLKGQRSVYSLQPPAFFHSKQRCV